MSASTAGRPAAGAGGPGREHRGAGLGLPARGPGSLAGLGVRVAALAVDWTLALVVTLLLAGPGPRSPGTGRELLVLVVFAVLVWSATALTGASLGQRLLGLRVVRLDRRPVGLRRGLVRTALIVLVLPALVTDSDGRGLHDLAAGTAVVRGPRTRAS